MSVISDSNSSDAVSVTVQTKTVEMAQLIGVTLRILCCVIGVICIETIDSSYNDEAQFVLDSFNDQPGSLYVYDSARIINAYKKVSIVLE